MENDLIRRSAVINAIRGEREYLIARKQLNAEHVLAHHFDAIMDDIPAVDAVEVCRCADCVHFEPFRLHDGFCKIDGMLHDNDFFCKDGQRREDGDK